MDSRRLGLELRPSLRKLSWCVLEADERRVLYLCQTLGIHEVLSRVLVNRGYSDPDMAAKFLIPKVKDSLPDPFLLKDIDIAADRIISAIQNQEKITIFADYDVDGATSSALLKKFLCECGISPDIYIPHRINEGYGPNIGAIQQIKANGTSLLITVDCGTTAFEPLSEAKKIGLDVIVLDHHMADGELPEALAIVNPNRLDDDFPYKSIAAVAVTFITVIAVRTKLRKINWFGTNKEPDLIKYLDLVALGTVCDIMPLTGLNRAFVAQGLQLIAKRNNLGLRMIADIVKLDAKPRSFHLGYIIGPRINAGGRISKPELGATLLTTMDPIEAHDIASKLNMLNQERREIEKQALDEIISQIGLDISESPAIFAVGENWHIGVLGILASRVKEQYNKPSIVISVSGGVGKGSARSIHGIDLGLIIQSAKEMNMLIDGGGHAMAGGFTIDLSKVNEFKDFVQKKIMAIKYIDNLFEEALELKVDSVITVHTANDNLIEILGKAEPFGNGNPQPRFAILNAIVLRATQFGSSHISLLIRDQDDIISRKTLKCIFFRALEKDYGPLLLNSVNKALDVVGTLQSDDWERSKVKFIIEDIAFHG